MHNVVMLYTYTTERQRLVGSFKKLCSQINVEIQKMIWFFVICYIYMHIILYAINLGFRLLRVSHDYTFCTMTLYCASN